VLPHVGRIPKSSVESAESKRLLGKRIGRAGEKATKTKVIDNCQRPSNRGGGGQRRHEIPTEACMGSNEKITSLGEGGLDKERRIVQNSTQKRGALPIGREEGGAGGF